MARRIKRSMLRLVTVSLVVATALAMAPDGATPPAAANTWPPPISVTDLSNPTYWPNDPGYLGQWNLFSFLSPDAIPSNFTDYEKSIGSGFHADKAWQVTTGDPRVVIAEIDSGIEWDEPDLVNKYYLSEGELPPPMGCGASKGTDAWDVNGDGVFNVQDYTTAKGHAQPVPATLCDSRISDTNGNGIIDPEDLIKAFANGVDDDKNGYVDDISGWDFFHDDDDPYDEVRFGHGTGEAKDSSAEVDNAIGDAGICASCRVMMIRAGDSFVVDAADFGNAVVYGVDNGATLVQEALGGIDNPPLARDAIDYAYAHHVAVVSSAADEDSFHHNVPGTANHTIYVHAIRFDGTDVGSSTTFLNYNNCTNYGGQLLMSVPGTGCSSEATGKTAGIVGLIDAEALAVDLPPASGVTGDPRRLTAGEVRQLLLGTVDSIWDPEAVYDPTTRYMPQKGWSQRFGYGRVNARSAVDAVASGKIPPDVEIDTPYWFQTIFSDRTPTIKLTGHIYYRSVYDSVDYTVEWAPGIEPMDGDFKTLTAGTMAKGTPIGGTPLVALVADRGTLASWDVSQLDVENPDMPPPDDSVNRHLVTVRVRVTAHSVDPTLDGAKGETRKTMDIVKSDPDLLPGFPLFLNASGEASAKTADLLGDGKREIVIGDAAGFVHAFKADGTELPGWPAHVNTMPPLDPANHANHLTAPAWASKALDATRYSPIEAAPAIGDLLGDGKQDVVIGSLRGYLYAFTPAGATLPGFPVRIDQSHVLGKTNPHSFLQDAFFTAPVLADLEGNGKLEIVQAGEDGYLYAWRADGSAEPGFPVLCQTPSPPAGTMLEQRRIVASTAVADFDGDKLPDIVVTTTENYNGSGRLYVVSSKGMGHAGGPYLPGFPIPVNSIGVLPYVGEGLPNAPVVADVNGDGKPEIVVSGIGQAPIVYGADGKQLKAVDNLHFGQHASSNDRPYISLVSNLALGDLDDDGTIDVTMGGAGFGAANAFAAGGTRLDFDHELGAWNTKTGAFLDGFPQRMDDWQFFMDPAIADVDGDGQPEVIEGSGGSWLRAWNAHGVQPAGWPKFTGGWIITSPALGDLDGDGKLELTVADREGWLFAWRTQGAVSGRVDWPSFQHDNRNSGNYDAPLDFGSRYAAAAGCSVSGGTGRSELPGLLALVGLIGIATFTARTKRRGLAGPRRSARFPTDPGAP